ncbi:ParA family protein, partial [Staphylococcus simulans]|uniref:ParA family protein n=1 Tax=Staphylococcus simulans TaxID=1286 RepID=UPI000FF12137
MVKIISINNFKGGVSKTSSTAGIAYTLANMKNKVLVVDLDPQADVTDILLKTFEKNTDYIKSALQTENLESLINTSVDEILDSLFRTSKYSNTYLYHTL